MQSTSSSMWDWFNTLSPQDRLPVTIVGFIFGAFALVFVVTIVSGTIYKIHKNRLDDSLKRELLDRGMTADEIVRVMRTRPAPQTARSRDYAPPEPRI